MILVAGLLTQSPMADLLRLKGDTLVIPARLRGGAAAGVEVDGWPDLIAGQGDMTVLRCDWTPELRRYAGIFALKPVPTDFGMMLGIRDKAFSANPRNGQNPAPEGLAVALARSLLRMDPGQPPEKLRARLPQLAIWAASRLRAAAAQADPIGPAGSEWQLLSSHEAYGDFFAIEEARLRHRLYDGGWSADLHRAVFVSGDASVVLPWDPIRDRVLLISQFRAAPALRGDPEPWLYEAIAGRVDATETPSDAARREACEEAGIRLGRLFEAPTHYPSPGAVAEMLYLFIGTADLPDGITGVGGLDNEDEDIRSTLVSRVELMEMIDDGRIRNGPLLVLGQWLERHAERLQRELAAGTAGLG